jgi:hypothetical protein
MIGIDQARSIIELAPGGAMLAEPVFGSRT